MELPSSSSYCPVYLGIKDEKYFERRQRNNAAAKKSRDARKIREDQIADRVNLLEHENALLRAQVAILKEESNVLKAFVVQKHIATATAASIIESDPTSSQLSNNSINASVSSAATTTTANNPTNSDIFKFYFETNTDPIMQGMYEAELAVRAFAQVQLANRAQDQQQANSDTESESD